MSKDLNVSNYTIRPVNQCHPTRNFESLILSKICSDIPNVSIFIKTWTHKNLPLTDPDFSSSKCINLLLGADLFPYFIQGRVAGYQN